jgi:hypothetical protein
MIRALAVVFGVAGATTLSQAPEFTQQYLQRLAGQVDALTIVVRDFDTSALAAGLGREDALQQMIGTDFLVARQVDMRRTFARHATLSDNLITLRAASPLQRLMMPARLADTATMAATWADFQPALPFSMAGFAAAGLGGVGGWAFGAALLSLLALPWRRLRDRKDDKVATPARVEPVLRPAAPTLVLQQRPRLMGERR